MYITLKAPSMPQIMWTVSSCGNYDLNNIVIFTQNLFLPFLLAFPPFHSSLASIVWRTYTLDITQDVWILSSRILCTLLCMHATCHLHYTPSEKGYNSSQESTVIHYRGGFAAVLVGGRGNLEVEALWGHKILSLYEYNLISYAYNDQGGTHLNFLQSDRNY